MKSTVTKSKTAKVASFWDYDLENMTPKDVLKKACNEAINQSTQQLPIYIRPLVDPFYLSAVVNLLHGKRSGEIVHLDLAMRYEQPSFLQCFYKESNLFNDQIKNSFNGTLVLRDVDKLNMTLQLALRGILSQIERDQLPIRIVSTGNSDINYMNDKNKFDTSLLYRLNGAEIVI